MSAEQLKQAVREYAEEHHPETRCIVVTIDTGAGNPPEVLVVVIRPGATPAADRRAS